MKKIYKNLIIFIFGALIIQSCIFIRQPDKYPLTVTEIRNSYDNGYDIYVIKDSNPNIDGWGESAMYIEVKDKRNKFKIGDTVVFSKK